VGSKRKLLTKVLSGSGNDRFADLVAFAKAFGFGFAPGHTSGSHHIFGHPELRELLNLQAKAGKAKPYQIRQPLQLVEEYDLKLEDA
jgi:hypothetical protein